ncbi:hypothetical protein WN55_08002 [Dufourea novaeangliae]|uniref:Uncharacterized protein n=1 Tax=Dufourea novaeangliae TaxID=178035 RepID=A0A154P738_DUFNO|nr:hypothetical protein WN55_08002 [Dufourea novaeangliae]
MERKHYSEREKDRRREGRIEKRETVGENLIGRDGLPWKRVVLPTNSGYDI